MFIYCSIPKFISSRFFGKYCQNTKHCSLQTTVRKIAYRNFSSKIDFTQGKSSSFDSSIIYFGRKYLWTLAELEENAIAKIGSMNEGSYEVFEAKMLNIAKEAGIVKPQMAIGIKFKNGAHPFVNEQPYPITKEEWLFFKKDAETKYEYMPKVFIIDGSKFTLPI